jgi:hypothetical protein
MINGEMVQFGGAKPHMMGDRVIVPLRAVYETMGANVEWAAQDRTVTVQQGPTLVELQLRNDLARINGNSITVDGPTHIMKGAAMVPVRFISDSIGASVNWDEDSSTVNIVTGGPSVSTNTEPITVPAIEPAPPIMSIQPLNSVLRVSLDEELSSETATLGEPFTATIDTNGNSDFFGLPQGTKVKGHVNFVQPTQNGVPGVLGLSFDGLIMNDGRRIGIWASLIDIDKNTIRNDDGRITVNSDGLAADDLKFVGTGAGAGELTTVVTKDNVIVGDALASREDAANVVLSSGMVLGVRIDREARIPAN